MLFFDIETKANKDALHFLEEPTAPPNWKDPKKIERYVEDKKEEMIEMAALDADFGQVVAIGMKEEDDPIHSMIGEEETLLAWFWNKFSSHNGKCCGYNILGFDLPYLMRRSMALGIVPKYKPFLAKYRTEPTRDLMGILYNWGQARSLKWVCQRYGIDNPLPELNGSKVAEMDDETLEKYVENDVRLIYELHEKMKGVYF